MPIRIEQRGRRLYFLGDTFNMKSKIKQAGATWDADTRAWYIGSTKRTEAERLVQEINGQGPAQAPQQAALPLQPAAGQEMPDDTKILGKALYKGKEYFVLFSGYTQAGYSVKLASRDGKIQFWVNIPMVNGVFQLHGGPVEVTKTYQEDRDGRMMTWGKYKRLRDEYRQKAQRAKGMGVEACGKCGGFHDEKEGDRTCYNCGCTKCDGAKGHLCEDD